MVHAAVEEAINHLIDFRKQEGAALEKKFREKIENIARLLESVAPYEQERVGKVKDRITDALEKTLSVDYDKNRLEQELIYYIEKLDINEEKQRLSNHLKYFISTLESGADRWPTDLAIAVDRLSHGAVPVAELRPDLHDVRVIHPEGP